MVNYNYYVNLGNKKITFTIPENLITDKYKNVTGSRSKCIKNTLPADSTHPYERITLTDVRRQLIFEIPSQLTNAYNKLQEIADNTPCNVKIETETFENQNRTLHYFTLTPGKITIPNPITRIIVDTETTGLDPAEDELLQIAIIDGNGTTLHNEYYKPEHKTSWPEAQRINHISPQQVKNKAYARFDKNRLQKIFDRAQEIIIYNAPFDLAFLAVLGLKFDTKKVTDTMKEYGHLYHHTRFYKLTDAARESRYTYKAHDALADCHATLAVQQRIDKRKGVTIIEQNQKPEPEPSKETTTTVTETTQKKQPKQQHHHTQQDGAWSTEVLFIYKIFMNIFTFLALIITLGFLPAPRRATGTLICILLISLGWLIYYIHRPNK